MKKRVINVIIICGALALLSIPAILRAGDDNVYGKAGEKIFNAVGSEDSDTIVFSTDDVEVTKGELTAVIAGNTGQGKSQDEIVKDAVKTVVTRKYLYAEAVKAGVNVTNVEYETYKKTLNDSIQKSENKDSVQAYFEGFGGEENYWKKMKPMIMQNLVIRKYLDEQVETENEVQGYSIEESPAERNEKDKLETQIKEEAYEEALTAEEEEKLIHIADKLYKGI